MHTFHAEFARQTTERRIAQAEQARAVRSLTRSTRAARGRGWGHRLVQPIAHPGHALARLVHPE